jgi:hypothetical protein
MLEYSLYDLSLLYKMCDNNNPNPFPILQHTVRRSSSGYTSSLASLTISEEGKPKGVGVKHDSYARYLAKRKGCLLKGNPNQTPEKYPYVAGCEKLK